MSGSPGASDVTWRKVKPRAGRAPSDCLLGSGFSPDRYDQR